MKYSPKGVMLRIAGQCNLDCIMCERRLRTEPDMTGPMADRVFDAVVPYVDEVELSGLGEPTIHPDFGRLALATVEAKKTLKFPTNGHFLDRSSVLDSIGETPLVSVSMDAACPETYRRVRTCGDFETVRKNVRLLRIEKPKADIWSTYVAGAYNVDEFPEFVDMAADLGVNKVVFKPVDCWALDREKASLRFQKSRTERAIDTALRKSDEHPISVHVIRPEYHPTLAEEGTICPTSFVCFTDIEPLAECPCVCGLSFVPDAIISNAQMVVDASGIVSACTARHPVGHLDRDSFAGILANPRYQEFLAARAEGREDAWCEACNRRG